MADWPSSPIAAMTVSSFHGGTSCSVTSLVTTTQETVSDARIRFRIKVAFHDHPYVDNGRGFFSAHVEKLTTNGWDLLATATRTLGNGSDDGDWTAWLLLDVQMTEPEEQYRIRMHCETRDTSFGTSEDGEIYLQAIQGEQHVGDFTLDFVPITIVYCPPGQDMTASLTQSETYGTRFTIGVTSGMQSQVGVEAKVDVLGVFGEGVGISDSQSSSNQSVSGIQISHFRNTVVTADNQKAIGRAYWGPLGDLFVVLVNPRFAVSRRADGTIFYALDTIQQVVVLPAWKLLRPGTDPIASAIPANARRKMLELDPFLRHLELFFPDSGADLDQAANPYLDPSGDNRAELLGRWWLDVGTEMTYAQGESHELFNTQTNEVSYASTVTIEATAGGSYDLISAALGVSESNTTSIGFQSSKETDASSSKSASCTIVRNQNERDLDGVALYYDKLFSTFMFRRLRARKIPGSLAGWAVVQGQVSSTRAVRLVGITVLLVGPEGKRYSTSTSRNGQYAFHNVFPGRYELIAGDRTETVTVEQDASWRTPIVKNLEGVRRKIDLRSSPIWEVCEALHLSSDQARGIAREASATPHATLSELAKRSGIDHVHIAEREHEVVIETSPDIGKR